ncbi:hypothetical protein ACM7Q1_05885 [Paenibacillus illinoisensis]|uniref:Ger(x)C family spore germination protein n=1 Tax=Paenibacillus illinoisensis TaxID=59845 RepID=UPI003A4DC875
MKWIKKTVISIVVCIWLCSITGCGSGKTNLEDATVPLALGLDVEDQKLHYYVSAPVFSKDIQKKSREAQGLAEGLRSSRNQQDAQFPGSVGGRNFQVIVVGKELLKYKDWFKVLDVTFRDPRIRLPTGSSQWMVQFRISLTFNRRISRQYSCF